MMSLGLLNACSTPVNQAPVQERTRSFKTPEMSAVSEPVRAPAEQVRGMYTIKKGDTLLHIALDHGLNYRDLVAWNNLANPNDIKVDDVLRVQAPDAPAVRTSAVSLPPPSTELRQPGTVKKTTPRGEKRVFSDAALADMQRLDGAEGGKAEAATPNLAPVKSSVPTSVPSSAAATAANPIPAALAPAPGVEDEKLSWIWPSDGKVIASFDEGKNKGIDIAGRAGQHVLAASAGKVMYAGSGIRGYGNLVIVKHSNSLLSAYAHNRSVLVKEGQSVSKGQTIAEMGDSDTDMVKLHFEIRQQGKPVDPSKFLPVR